MNFSPRAQSARLQAMIDMLRSGLPGGRLPNCSTFARTFHVSRFTALRDLDFLRDDWGAPILYDASRKGYYLSDPAWTVPALRLDRREVFALGIARKVMAAFRGTPLEADMQAALARVTEALDGHVTMEPAALTDRISVLGEDYAPQDPAVWMAAARLCQRRERARMRYRRFDGTVKDYEIAPVHLAAYHGEWYLLANRRGRAALVTFAMSRIARIAGTGAIFEEPDPGVVRRSLDERFGIVGGEEMLDVRLRFSPAVAAYIAGRVWHPSQEIIERRDGSVELRMRTRGWKEMVRFVLSWQPDVTVLRPESLRERLIEKMRAGLAGRDERRTAHGARSRL